MGDSAGSSDPLGLMETESDDPEALAMMRRIEANLFDAPNAPVRIGRFALRKILGSGGMGVVHLAHDHVLDRRVAIKLILGERLTSDDARARLLREARAMARVSHPNVVQVYEAGEQSGRVFVAMELVEGSTLGRWLADVGASRPWRERLEVLLAAGRGLAAAHRAGVVHRDFKPENVLLDADGQPKVSDFGLAGTPIGPSRLSTGEVQLDAITRTGAVVGTPRYMAPEQFAGRTADERSDQFAFCIVAWETLVGQRPFAGDSMPELAANVVEGTRRPVPRGCRVPRWLLAVVERGLEVDPTRRWPNMEALLGAMSARRRRGPLIAGGVVAVAIAGLWLARPDTTAAATACDGGSQLAGIWDEDRSAAIGQAMKGSGRAHAETTYERIVPLLDAWTREWTQAYTNACMAEEAGDAVAAVRVACLDHARQELRYVADDFAIAQPDAMEHAVNLVSSLPRIDRCDDPERMTIDAASLADPELRGVLDGLARAEVLVDSRRLAEADALLIDLQGQALAHQRDALEATALLRRSQAAFIREAHDDAHQLAAQGLALAERASSPWLELEAWRRLAVASRLRGELDRAAFELDRAESLAARHGADPERVAELQYDRATLLSEMKRHEEAVRGFEAALAALRELSPEHPRIASVLTDMGASLLAVGRQKDALAAVEESVAITSRRLGPTHPGMKTALVSAANQYTGAGRIEDALRLHRQALAIAELYPEDHPAFLAGLAAFVGQDLGKLGRLDEAAEAFAHAAERAARLPPGDPVRGYIAMGQGNLALERRRWDDAIAFYEQAVALTDDRMWANRGIALANLALALARAGRVEAAVEKVTEARTTTTELAFESPLKLGIETYGAEIDRLAGHTDRAREVFGRIVDVLERVEVDAEVRFIALFGAARVDPDRARARTLAARAAEVARELPEHAFGLDELAAWRAQHDLDGANARSGAP